MIRSGYKISDDGFTLLELMIAITLMAFMSVLTTQSIQRAIQTKNKLQKTLDQGAQSRDALRVMERDIQLAFHHRDFSVDIYNQAIMTPRQNPGAQQGANQQPNGNQPPNQAPNSQNPQPGQPLAPNQMQRQRLPPVAQLSFFYGEEGKLTFSTRTNVRTQVNENVSQHLRVSYFLESCKSRRDHNKSVKCLVRKSSPYFDDGVEILDGTTNRILEGVESMKFRYLPPESGREWASQWKSKLGDAGTQGRFPLAVEVTLEVLDLYGKGKPFTVQTVAAIRNPNNPQPGAGQQLPGGFGGVPGAQGAPGFPGAPGVGAPSPGGVPPAPGFGFQGGRQ